MYILSEDNSENLVKANGSLKNNLKTWLNQYKMINDSVEIMDGKIVNLGIEFSLMPLSGYNKSDLLIEANGSILKEVTKRKLELGEPFYLSDVYKALRRIRGVLDVLSVEVFQVTEGIGNEASTYNSTLFNVREQMSRDGRILLAPLNVAFEFKNPSSNIIGTVI